MPQENTTGTTVDPTQSVDPQPGIEPVDHAALLAELEAQEAQAEQPEGEQLDPTAEATDEDGLDEEAEEAEPEEEVDEEAEEAEPEEAADDDAEEDEQIDTKALDAIKRKEKRMLATVERERAELRIERDRLERRAAQLEQAEGQQKSLEEFRQDLERRAVADPIGFLRDHGVGPDHWEDIARESWGLHKGDPNYRVHARQARGQREVMQKVADLERQVSEFQAREQERVQQQQTEQQVQVYLTQVTSAVDDDTPVVAHLLRTDEAEAQMQFRRAAFELLEQTGEVPDPVDVVRAVEERERALLKRRGISVDAVLGAKRKPKSQAAGQKKTATITSDLGTKTAAKAEPRSYEEEVEALLRDAESGRI